ncbi:hypothetical protein [Croceicoccus naphthovorans]|uniref:hypothetical protein n=1 Tax=Croceicoccus naphthovorans TaxID=1348774 RepID=UPI0017FBB21E|nr:hypothetical protein [Croceicoccus naphthovorans]MBB3991666.1 hypothetical protein [Croceicoccus naphthovorans]
MLRPVIAPPSTTAPASDSPSVMSGSNEARGVQYFVASPDKAYQVIENCRNGSVRGDECANAEEAIIKVEAAERRKRFLGN